MSRKNPWDNPESVRAHRLGVKFAAARRSKYRNVPTVVDGIRFDSKRESERWAELRLQERAGDITDLRRQPVFVLADKVKFHDEARTKPAIRYRGDFAYSRDNERIVEDVKSPQTAKTAAFRIKRHLVMHLYGVDVRIVE